VSNDATQRIAGYHPQQVTTGQLQSDASVSEVIEEPSVVN
jgi:hypothetical protein